MVEGETLAERIAKGPIPFDEAIPLFIQIAEGMEAAHEKNIIHRDLKPANIMIGPDGKPKILDFGLAKAFVGAEESVSDSSQSPTLMKGTALGVIMGTASYMSPEQARGRTLDKRTDIWSFGCVLYEALTGKRAFTGDTVPDTLMAVLGKEPDWNALPKDTSSRLRQLLSRTLRKNARLRLHDIADARIELDDDLSDPRIGLARAERSLTRVAVTAVAAGMLTGLAVWSAMRSSAPDAGRVSRTAILLPSGEVLERDERAPAFAISPNGQYVAYITRRGSETQLYLRSVDELDPTPIDGADGARMPFFSPDSAWLGFIADGELRKVSLTGGAPVTIASVDPNYRGISWGDGGTIVLSTNNTELWRVPVEGGEPERLTIPDRERGERAHRFPTLLPGGEAVLFTVLPGDVESWDDASLAVLSLETGEYDVVLEGGRFSKYSPTGHLIYARAGSLLAVPFDLAELDIKGAPVPLVQEVAMSLKDGSSEFALSSDGSLLYAPGGSWGVDHRVVWVDRTGRVEPILTTPRAFVHPALSPDGARLVLNVDDANPSIWIYDLERSTLTPLARGFLNWFPRWTPDGRRVSFSTSGTIAWQAADGSGPAETLTEIDRAELSWQIPVSWSPDGKSALLIESRPQTGLDIGILSMEGEPETRPFLQEKFNEGDPAFSPNGRWVAYVSDESGRFEVYVRPFPGPGARATVSTGGGRHPGWNPNGRELFYRSGDKVMAVDVQADDEISLGKPRALFERSSLATGEYDVARDGQRFVMIEEGESAPPPTHLVLIQNWAEELKRLVPIEN